jgi:uncharacterized protein YcfJ
VNKFISTFLLASLLAVVPAMPASASTNDADSEFVEIELIDPYETAETAGFAASAALKPCPSGTYRVRRNTRTKKKLVNSLIAGGIGAAVGGGLGGGRGALLGAGAGSGGYLVYRYVRDRRGRCVPRYVRRG